MNISNKGIQFIQKEESCVLTSYPDSAGIWTIGWGSIMYRSGARVKRGETITQSQADDLLHWEVGNKTAAIQGHLKGISLNQNQTDALISFTYNVGVGAFAGSTLLKKVKANPCDHYIRDCFIMWNKITVNGKKVESKGLTNRRKREADFYFSPLI